MLQFATFKAIFSPRAVIDVMLVTVMFYQIIAMLKGTRAVHVLIGLLLIFITYVISNLLRLDTLHWIINKFYSSFILVVIVLFQDDIRRILSKFGKGPQFTTADDNREKMVIDEVISAAKLLSHERIGALIVFERSIGLDRLYDHSVKIDALVSEQLLSSIFQSFSPLHDGAVIIQKNRVTCASAQLPLSKNPRFSGKLGTRHSAAVGISEETDSVILVVSEETGHISISWEGNIQRQSSPDVAKKMLYILLLPEHNKSWAHSFFEEQILKRLHKYSSFFYSLFEATPHPTVGKEFEQKETRKNTAGELSSKENLQTDIIYENKLAMNAAKSLTVKFPKKFNLDQLKIEHQAFFSLGHEKHLDQETIDENNISSERVNSANENSVEDLEEFEDQRPKDSNSEKAQLQELTEEERFNPPIPKSSAPRNVSIGGVPLNPPVEKKSKHEKETLEKETKNSDEDDLT